MKTKEQVLKAIKSGRESRCAIFDSRDYARLCEFFSVDEWPHFGFELKKVDAIPPSPIKWTKKNILVKLKSDLGFAFEKALNRRGISSNLMYEVIKMWMWILEDELQYHDEYAMYGLPLYKAVALKYGFENFIGDDVGNERKYGEY